MSEMDEIKNVEEEAENEMFDEPMVGLSWKFNFDKMKFSMQVFRHKKPAYDGCIESNLTTAPANC